MKKAFSLKECLKNDPWDYTYSLFQIDDYHSLLKQKISAKKNSRKEILFYLYFSYLKNSELTMYEVSYLNAKIKKRDIPFLFLLSVFCKRGYSVYPKDESLHFHYLKICSENSYGPAHLLLSFCYFNGTGTNRDFSQSYFVMKKCPPSDKRSLFLSLIRLYNTDSSEKIDRELFELTCFAKRGFSEAYYYLGCYYQNKDSRQSVNSFMEGYAIGSMKCGRELGYYYLNKKGKENQISALSYFLGSTQYEDCLFLAGLLFFGLKNRSKETHENILKQSSESGNAFSEYLLSCLWYPKYPEKAKKMLWHLAEFSTEGSFALSKIYQVEGKYERSVYFLRRSRRELDGKDLISLVECYEKEYPYPDLFIRAVNNALMIK